MAIRIRQTKLFNYVALCAAETEAEPGDIYLNDGIHHALYVKFDADRRKEGEPNEKHQDGNLP